MRRLVLVLLAACGGDELSDVRPAISRLPFDLAPYDPATFHAGALDFRQQVSRDKVLLEFAGLLIDGGTGPDGIVLPQMAVRLANAQIKAPADGVVVGFEQNPLPAIDFEIRIRAVADSRWEIGLDHVSEPTIVLGSEVRAGDVLGTGVNNEKFEFDIYDHADGTRRWCPNLFMGDDRDEIEAQLLQLFNEWEAYRNNANIYDESAMFAPGCAMESYLPE